METHTTNKKLVLIIICGFIASVIIIGFLAFSEKRSVSQSVPPAPPTPQQFLTSVDQIPVKKTIIGATKEEEIVKLPTIEKITELPDKTKLFELPSALKARPTLIETANGVASFERDLTPEDSHSYGYLPLSFYIKSFGSPEKIIKGSKFYGWFINTYIYGKLGLAIIANDTVNHVFEIHTFSPMTPDEYLKQYGSDIQVVSEPPIERLSQ